MKMMEMKMPIANDDDTDDDDDDAADDVDEEGMRGEEGLEPY